MAAKPRKTPTDAAPPQAPTFPPPGTQHGQAQNIWLAGLGALASAQAEGGKAFEALVKQGLEMQERTQALAKEQWSEAAQRMGTMTAQATGAAGSWDRLGGIFEGRVARALASLGMPSASEITELRERVHALEQKLAAAEQRTASTPGRRKPPTPSRS